VDSRGGAGGTVGTGIAANAPPDGYTILLGIVSPMAVNVTLYGSKLKYDPLKSFAPISMITKVPQVLSVHPNVPAKTITQLVDHAKQSGTQLNYGSAGSGTTGHLTAELFKKRAGISMTHVPFKGSGPALAAILGAQIEVMLSGPPAVLSHTQSGRLRALAVSSKQRTPVLPDVPAFVEAGLPIEITSWYCLVAPAGTPAGIIERLHTASVAALKSPQVSETLLRIGAPPEPSSPEELREFLRAEIRKFAEVIAIAGAKLD
jgi:tripartite-type tricarboxylate transporter receptor subunit TctC